MERERQVEGRGGRGSKQKLRSLYKLLISGRRRSRSSSSRGKWENGKAANQQNDYPNSQLPPATPLLPPSQAQKFTAKNIFYNSLPTLFPRELHLLPSIVGRGVEPKGDGAGRQSVSL